MCCPARRLGCVVVGVCSFARQDVVGWQESNLHFRLAFSPALIREIQPCVPPLVQVGLSLVGVGRAVSAVTTWVVRSYATTSGCGSVPSFHPCDQRAVNALVASEKPLRHMDIGAALGAIIAQVVTVQVTGHRGLTLGPDK